MNKLKGYIAGSLFNEAEVRQRLYEGQMLASATGDQIDWYNPIEQPINDKAKLPTAVDIFNGDTQAVVHADFILADITNNDVGVAMELGIAYGLQYARNVIEQMFAGNDAELLESVNVVLDKFGIKPKMIYSVCSDIRVVTAGEYDTIHIPYGINQYLVGGLESMPGEIHSKFDNAVKAIVEDLHAAGEVDAE